MLATPGQVSLQLRDDITTDPVKIVAVAAGTVVNLDTGAQFEGGDAIQDAVDNADDDQTLLVGLGEFDGVEIDVDGLTLAAADGAEPTIQQDGGDIVTIENGADDVTIDRLTIQSKNRRRWLGNLSEWCRWVHA